MMHRLLILAMMIAVAGGCQGGREGGEMPPRDINAVHKAHVDALMAIPGVTAVGVGALADDRPCIRVYVTKRTPELLEQIPKELEGYPVEVVESGEIKGLDGS